MKKVLFGYNIASFYLFDSSSLYFSSYITYDWSKTPNYERHFHFNKTDIKKQLLFGGGFRTENCGYRKR